MSEPDGPEQREADNAEYYEREADRIDQFERDADESRDDCHSNEFGERIPHIIALTPVDSSPVTDKILDAMKVLR